MSSIKNTNFDRLIINDPSDKTCVINGELSLSKHGLPCLYESGGAYSHKGEAQIICSSRGNAKRPLHVFTRGTLACSNHAVIPVKVGDVIVKATTTDKHVVEASIFRIDAIDITTLPATYVAKKIPCTMEFSSAVLNAANKACDYHCREPYYIRIDNTEATEATEAKE